MRRYAWGAEVGVPRCMCQVAAIYCRRTKSPLHTRECGRPERAAALRLRCVCVCRTVGGPHLVRTAWLHHGERINTRQRQASGISAYSEGGRPLLAALEITALGMGMEPALLLFATNDVL